MNEQLENKCGENHEKGEVVMASIILLLVINTRRYFGNASQLLNSRTGLGGEDLMGW